MWGIGEADGTVDLGWNLESDTTAWFAFYCYHVRYTNCAPAFAKIALVDAI
jgi:hypothetical protein